MAVALLSLARNDPVRKIAMTRELTLTGGFKDATPIYTGVAESS